MFHEHTQQPPNPDDSLLIDYHLGECPSDQVSLIRQRLEDDSEFADRSDRVTGLLKLLDHCPAGEPSELLMARTLAAVESARRTTALLNREAAQPRPGRFPIFSLKELGAVAAMLVLAATVLVPGIRQARLISQQQACLARAGQIGTAVIHYANQNNGFLPTMATQQAAWLPSAPVAARVSNSRNLWRLVAAEYATPALFQCPSGPVCNIAVTAGMIDFPNPNAIAYSYHDGVNSKPLNITDPALQSVAAPMAILADRTPVFQDGRFSRDRLCCQNSPNHGERGQSVLYLDAHAAWQTSGSVGVNGDNIWTVQGVDNYCGVEKPAHETDSFLLPSFVEDGGR